MRIHVSDFSDFCFGVKRAIGIAEDTLKRGIKPVYSLGAIIHNKEVVKRLEKKGLKVLKGDIRDIKKGTVVICSHGVYPERLQGAKGRITIADATCPFVKKAQKIAKEMSRKGYQMVIIGDKGHPEVSSLKRFAGENAVVISNIKEAADFKRKAGKVGVIAQTTQSSRDFGLIVARLKKNIKGAKVKSTICHDADMRQRSTERMARHNKLMIVVGGKDSANTKRLYAICRKAGTRAYHIETAREIDRNWFESSKSVGIVSGASTPKWIVDEVVARVKRQC